MRIINTSVKLTSKHQLTVPANVVRKLGLSAGDRLNYEIHNGAIVLKPRPTNLDQLEKLWQNNAQANKGVASDESIKSTLRQYHKNQTARP